MMYDFCEMIKILLFLILTILNRTMLNCAVSEEETIVGRQIMGNGKAPWMWGAWAAGGINHQESCSASLVFRSKYIGNGEFYKVC